MPEHGAHADVAWRLPRRRRGSPGSSPWRAHAGRAPRPARAACGNTGATRRLLSKRRHRHQAADVAVELQERAELVRRHAGLRRLAGEVHLDERGDLEPLRGRLGVERVDELADPVDDLRLSALQVADEVPAERVAVDGVLRLHVLRAVLPHDLDPASASAAMSWSETYFVAATTVTFGPTSSRIAA